MGYSSEEIFQSMRKKLETLGSKEIPLIGYCSPELLGVNNKVVRIKIPLNSKTKNHMNSMYFGALTIGADLSSGLHAYYFSQISEKEISFAFKTMNADFIYRSETDVIFESQDGPSVQAAFDQSLKSGERVNQPVKVSAFDLNGKLAASFEMILSIKVL